MKIKQVYPIYVHMFRCKSKPGTQEKDIPMRAVSVFTTGNHHCPRGLKKISLFIFIVYSLRKTMSVCCCFRLWCLLLALMGLEYGDIEDEVHNCSSFYCCFHLYFQIMINTHKHLIFFSKNKE